MKEGFAAPCCPVVFVGYDEWLGRLEGTVRVTARNTYILRIQTSGDSEGDGPSQA